MFGGDSAGPVVDLVYVPDPAATAGTATLLAAARSAIHSGALVAVTHGSGLSGFLRALRQEHPDIGITLLRVPASVDGLCVAQRYATVEPGAWREFVLPAEGVVSEVAPRPLVPHAEESLPLGRDDVVLVSGGGKGIAYECAAALARASGVSLALLGRSDPDTDDVLRANLDRLRTAGLRIAYESADVTDHLAVTRGVGRLVDRLGPVTAVLHGSGINEPTRFADLDETRVAAHVAPKVLGLGNLLASVDRSRLRLLVTFGSIIGRYGLAGESHYALANGALRAEAERLADELPRCRVLNIDWSVWAGAGMGEQLGVLDTLLRLDVTPIPASDGVAVFLSLLRTTDLPTTVAVHGRIGGLLPTGGTRLAGRFLDRVLVHYAGMELVADSDLDLSRDPYLNDHRIDGLPVLPAVVGMEAMAQAAAALAGRPLLRMVDVTLDRPVVVPDNASRTVRVCALRQGDVIQVALRSDETGYCVDHFRATFPLAQPGEPIDRPDQSEEDIKLGPDDLYGPLYFHTGGFRLVERFTALSARYCHVHLRGPDGEQLHPVVSDAPLLGEFTSNDATVHALQACVPHRRLLPVGCERFTRVAGTSAPREIYATERHAGNGEYVWDVLGLDRFGKRAVRWVGLRLRDVGPLAVDRLWPPALLGVYIERSAIALGLHPDLRVTVGTGDRFDRAASALD
ncbi:MAG TPA: SDR family oxidoreductase, partial [Pseudonocardiaceae bacterium]